VSLLIESFIDSTLSLIKTRFGFEVFTALVMKSLLKVNGKDIPVTGREGL
jgi:hypothetical protein